MLTRRCFLKTAGAAAASTLLGSMTCARDTRPNVVVLFSDELAFEFLSCYGGDIETPNIDKLASQGLIFTNAYSAAPMCTPSRFSLLTGLYPGRWRHSRFLEEFPDDVPYSIAWNTFIGPENIAITQRLSQNGYLTGVTGKWHIGSFDADREVPTLDPEDDPADPAVDEKLRQHQAAVVEQVKKDVGCDMAINVSWDNFDSFPVKRLKYHNFPWINQGAITFLEAAKKQKKPFFLYAATTAVHGPAHHDMFNHDLTYTPGGKNDDVLNYIPPVEEIKSKLASEPPWKSHKIAGMACLDHHVELVLDKIKEMGQEDNTIVIFLADHNVEPGKATCYDKGNRVPMIIKWPQKIMPGSTSEALVQSVDIVPTLLELAGLSAAVEQVDGKSLTPVFRHPASAIRTFVYLESGYSRAITDGQFKYIAFRPPRDAVEAMKIGLTKFAPNHLNVDRQAHSHIAIEHFPHYFDVDQLYDLARDPYEQKNIIDDPRYADKLAELKVELEKRLATFKHPFDLAVDPFLSGQTYRRYAANTRAIGTDYIPWLPRDHGTIVWPPEE
ncbi:hypothetical protein EH223_14800 [candidate division KSB1 bacterium]|nr:sulfatase-like hydrolase/transferase [candidate division KSB1 bacterium]RQW01585.1 MAG: hypothetical protein EH223_14800 [candidate division KSB1 bacterium]